MLLQRTKYLAAIYRPKCLCGSFGIQEKGCKTLGESKTKEGQFEMAGPGTSGRPTNCGLS